MMTATVLVKEAWSLRRRLFIFTLSLPCSFSAFKETGSIATGLGSIHKDDRNDTGEREPGASCADFSFHAVVTLRE